MSDTLTEGVVRVTRFAPPEEASSNIWWVEAHRYIINIIEANEGVFEENFLPRPYYESYNKVIRFGAYSLKELRLFMAMIPQPKKWDKDSEGKPKLKATVNGWNFELVRYDLTCDIVETGEFKEVEEVEVVEPAKMQKVVKQVPVTTTECPSMMSE